jgi:hypothetical protein
MNRELVRWPADAFPSRIILSGTDIEGWGERHLTLGPVWFEVEHRQHRDGSGDWTFRIGSRWASVKARVRT